MKRSSSRFWWLVLFLTLLRPPSVPSWLGPAVAVDGAPCAVLVHPDQGLPTLAAQGLMPVQWPEAGQQLLRRIQWDVNGSSPVRVMALSEFCRAMERGLNASLAVGIDWPALAELPRSCATVMEKVTAVPTRLFFNSTSASLAPWPSSSAPNNRRGRKLQRRVLRLMARNSMEELVWAFLLLMDKNVGEVEAVQDQLPHPSGWSLARATAFCGPQFLACMASPNCMKGLFCVARCHLDDQTCSYRCLLKYDSWLITKFSSCAFQKQNVMNFHAARPKLPHVKPVEGFDNTQLNVRAATRILMGHASKQKYSWMVAAASSEAYAQFSLQYQIWYYRKSVRRLYYKAVFLAEGRDGRDSWHSRSYQVLPLRTPGSWLFAANDGGVQLREHWYLLGADASLRWMVLYFTGSAKKAGMAYRGCMLLTPDGQVPGRSMMPIIAQALARAEMQPWELRPVNNTVNHTAGPPPLEVSK